MNATPTPRKTTERLPAKRRANKSQENRIMKKNRFLGSIVAMVGAAVAVAFLAVGPVGGQDGPAAAPAKGGGGKGGGGGKAPAAPPGPVPRTKEGKPDMSGFWGGVTPSAATSIEPAQAKGGGGG